MSIYDKSMIFGALYTSRKNSFMRITRALTLLTAVIAIAASLSFAGAAQASVPSSSAQADGVTCGEYWDTNNGWAGGFNYVDTVYAGYCWDGSTVWSRYGPDCTVDVNLQVVGSSPYGNKTTSCFISGTGTDQLLVGFNWNWYTYLSPWDENSGNYLRFTVDAHGQITGRWGQAGV